MARWRHVLPYYYSQDAQTWITQFLVANYTMLALIPQPQSITALWLVLILPSRGG